MATVGLIMAIGFSVAWLLFVGVLVLGSYEDRDAPLGGVVYSVVGLLIIWSIWAAWQ